MYKIVFAERLDYRRSFENTWMQHFDGGGQAHKLAVAVYTYATHIDRLEELTAAVDHIPHRHVSTRVLPEQYPLIGEKLLQAIKDVLQDAATEEVIAAWAEAYESLANVFIQKEKFIYQQDDQALTDRLARTDQSLVD